MEHWIPVSSGSPTPPERTAPSSGPPRAPSSALLGPRGELIIEHAGEEYRLRRTRNGKLILTK